MQRQLIAILASLALAAPAAAAADADARGFLYGTVETSSGKSYTGLLRWGNEEAFWDDHFNGSKRDEPATGELPRGFERQRRRVQVFGLELSGPWEHGWAQRQLTVRFGDLAEILPRGERAEIVLKSGDRLQIEGGSNDFDAEITVYDPALGEVEIDWDRIRSIRFAVAPAGTKPYAQRLRGKVKTTVGEFSGWLAWDSQEATTIDELDGESEDGELSIAMGKIRAIERRTRRSATVELTDGRRLELSGTNDVDASIRGICIEDARFGRVEIPWDVFERVEIEAAADSGRGYDDFPALGALRARVTTVDGKSREGEIAFDLDESAQWEMLDGMEDDVEYTIPFARVESIRRLGSRRSEVTLAGGEKLELEGQTDVDESNAGIAFLGVAGDDGYLRWTEVEKIEFR